MGLIQKLLKGGTEEQRDFKERLKQAQTEDRVANIVEERKKSANQRELERYIKEQQEEKIKQTLNQIHKKNNSELWKSKNGILDKGTSILKDDRPILKEKNIFMNNQNIFKKEHLIKSHNDMGFFK